MKGIAKQKVPVWYGEKHKKTTWSNFSLLLLIMIFLLLKTVASTKEVLEEIFVLR